MSSEQRDPPDFRAVFESFPDPCLLLTPDLRISAVNDAYLDLSGTMRDAIVGRDVLEVFPGNRADPAAINPEVRNSLEQVLATRVTDVVEVLIGSEEDDSPRRTWKISHTPVFGKDHELAYILLLVHEVTESRTGTRGPQKMVDRREKTSDIDLLLKQTNEQLAVQNEKLRESEQKFASFMVHLPAVAWIKDLDSRYVYVNPQAERTFPPAPRIVGCTDFDIFPEDTARQFRDTDHRVLAEGSIRTTEVLRDGAGILHHAIVTRFPLAGPDGQPSYVAGIGFDITERIQAEEALRKSEELFHAIFNLAAVGIAQVTPDGTLHTINQKFSDIIGYSFEELLKLTAYQISHPDDIERHLAELRRLMAGEIADYAIEKRLIHKNGSIVWVHLTVTVVRNPSGEPEYLIAIVQDINERKRAEEDLRESEEKFYKVFNLAPIGIAISTLEEGVIVEFNRSAERLSGYHRDEVIGHPSSDFRAWKDPVTRGEIVSEIVDKGEVRDREVTFIDRNGRDFWGLVSGVVIEVRGQKHLLLLLSDINERKRDQEALRLSEERFRLLAETAPVMIWEAGPEGRCTFLNKQWGEYTGREIKPGEDVLDGWTEGIHPDDLEGFVSTFISALNERRDFSLEYRLRRSDGDYGWVVNTGVPRFAQSGELLGYIGTCFDITERKRVKEALQHDKELLAERVAERTAELRATIETLHGEINERIRMAQALQAETAERLKVQDELREKELLLSHQSRLAAMGEMIGNIAHQWRQPLNLLGLLAQELPMTYKIGQFSAEYLDDIVKKMLEAIHHMSQTINDFRRFFSPDKEKVDFRVLETVKRTLSLMEGSLKAGQIETRLILNGDPVINGYPNEFSQVILNIIGNAKDEFVSKKVPNPVITIEIAAEDGRSLVTITDNAGGIAEDVIGRIFDPYFTTKGPEKGTGVGLYMSKMIVEKNMGGILDVRNVAGGAQFRIII